MSRVAKKADHPAKGVELKDADGVLSVKGPKGTLSLAKPVGVSVSNRKRQRPAGCRQCRTT